ncbi:hypothetical protein ZOSMA_281G00240, partial [Zostera marina]
MRNLLRRIPSCFNNACSSQ